MGKVLLVLDEVQQIASEQPLYRVCGHCQYIYYKKSSRGEYSDKARLPFCSAFLHTYIMNENEIQPELTEPIKKKNHLPLYCFFGLLFVAGICGGWWFYHYQHDTDEEYAAFLVLEDNECLADYEAFMEKYPQSEYLPEVKERYNQLTAMHGEWNRLRIGGTRSDYLRFRANYPQSTLVRQCELKIDSLDWLAAKEIDTPEAYDNYLREHPDGRYLSEASIAQGKLAEAQPTDEERMAIAMAISNFFQAFGKNDEEGIFACITPTMTQFLSKHDATKVDVANIISRTYNEHILSCRFNLNDDYTIRKSNSADDETCYTVAFSVDQYIERDNEGKTFGSYTAEAVLTGQFKLQSLTMVEKSRR